MSTTLINTLAASQDKTITGTYQNNSNGHSGTYTDTVTHESNGTVDVSLSATRDDGHTYSADTVYTVVSATQVTSQTQITNFDGQQISVTRSFTLNADGSIALTADWTRPHGTETVTGTITHANGVSTETATFVDSNGTTGSFTLTDSHSNGSFDWNDQIQIVGVNGQTHDHSVDISGTYQVS